MLMMPVIREGAGIPRPPSLSLQSSTFSNTKVMSSIGFELMVLPPFDKVLSSKPVTLVIWPLN